MALLGIRFWPFLACAAWLGAADVLDQAPGPRNLAWFTGSLETSRPLSWVLGPEEASIARNSPEEEEEGSMVGALSFGLLAVPLLYIAFKFTTDTGIVVIARPQDHAAPQEASFVNELVLVASIEHDITYDLNVMKPERAKVSAGGLGKVAGQLQRIHPSDLISVHPVYGDTKYGFERGERGQGMPEAKRRDWREDGAINVTVDGVLQTVQVFRRTVVPERFFEGKAPQVTYILLEHPWFRSRTGIYLDQPGSVATLRFFSLWNQAVGVLIAREDPRVYQCPDYHTALAPWYALRACGRARPPPRVTVVLHNAEYQGAISSQQLQRGQVRRLAKILDLPRKLIWNHMMIEGGFNMLQAAMEYILITQRGYGVCAVSKTYAAESKVKHRVLWPLPEVVGLENPMLENERPKNPKAPAPPPSLEERRRAAKEALYAHEDFRPPEGEGQRGYGFLTNKPEARIFVFLGRWVKQKGMDYIADIAEWMVSRHADLQLAIIGPPGDSFGTYSALKLQVLATNPRFAGRLKVLPEFYNINQIADDIKFAFDFCLMPSRDEPFGYVDIEFGWFGALTVGSITGGLGKVPGIYFIPSNVNSTAHICHLFKACVNRAMALSDGALLRMGEEAIKYTFPVESWQADLLALYDKACRCGNRVGTDTTYLRRYPGVFELFANNDKTVARDPKAPRRGPRTAFGTPSLEDPPTSFSQELTERGEAIFGRVEVAQGSSFRPDGTVETASMEVEEFIRREVDDGAIQGAVESLVREEALRRQEQRFDLREPLGAQDILAVTQWQAMAEGEFTEGMRLSLRRPLFGCCTCLTKFLTAWLAGEFCGVKRIDFFIALHYLTAPLLQAICVAQLPNPDRNKWPMIVGALVLPASILFWTRLSMSIQPNIVMAMAVILRIPLLFVPTIAVSLSQSLDSILLRIVLFVLLNFLAGADQIFVFYNFMGAAIGDISKLGLRLGTCNGILVATTSFGQVAISAAVNQSARLLPEAMPISFIGLAVDVLLAVLYTCAPAPYREFCLPEWDLKAMWQHRRTLKYIFVSIVLGAVTDPSVSGGAVVLWRAAKKPFSERFFLGASPALVYAWLVPCLTTLAVVSWSYLLYRSPNRSNTMVKASAFLLVPPAAFRCSVALFLEDNDEHVTLVDVLFLFSLLLDVIKSTCTYLALLSVVGSRWRFVSFLTVALACRQSFSAFVQLVVATFVDTGSKWDAVAFASHWMPPLLFFCALHWIFSLGGFWFFDRESSALLIEPKRKLIRKNNWRLSEYLRSLETAAYLAPVDTPSEAS